MTMLLVFSVWVVGLLCPDEFERVSDDEVPSLVLATWLFLLVWVASFWIFILGGYS
jgi:hypothetical protein